MRDRYNKEYQQDLLVSKLVVEASFVITCLVYTSFLFLTLPWPAGVSISTTLDYKVSHANIQSCVWPLSSPADNKEKKKQEKRENGGRWGVEERRQKEKDQQGT